jgi:hypothetical protein
MQMRILLGASHVPIKAVVDIPPPVFFCIRLYSSFVGPWPTLQFTTPTHSIGLLGRGIRPSRILYLQTGKDKHRIHAHKRPCLQCDFEPTISVLERAKTVHVLDCVATPCSTTSFYQTQLQCLNKSSFSYKGGFRRTD